MTDDELVAAFEKAAVHFGITHDLGRPKLANDAYEELDHLARLLQTRGEEALKRLSVFLTAEVPWIRYAAAAYLLDLTPEQAVPVLVDLSHRQKALGMAAYTTLRNWELQKESLVTVIN